jgi:hypothetical protein
MLGFHYYSGIKELYKNGLLIRMRNVRTNLRATPPSPSAASGPERCVRLRRNP